MENSDATTITVLRSQAVARPDGRFAILLETKEAGAIAFEVDRKAIASLRREIGAIEAMMNQTPGNS